MAPAVQCIAKGCKIQFADGGSHEHCPRHSTCNVNQKYNPEVKSCPHCLQWLTALRSSGSSKKLKLSSAYKLRSWVNHFRRLRLDKKLSGEWVSDIGLKKFIYNYTRVSSYQGKHAEGIVMKEDVSDSPDDALPEPSFPLTSQSSSFSSSDNLSPVRTILLSNKISPKKSMQGEKSLSLFSSSKQRLSFLPIESSGERVSVSDFSQIVPLKKKVAKDNLPLSKDELSSKSSESHCSNEKQLPCSKHVSDNRDSSSPEISELPSTSKMGGSPFNPNSGRKSLLNMENYGVEDTKEIMMNTFKDIYGKIASVKTEVKMIQRDIDRLVVSHTSLQEAFKQNLDARIKDIEDEMKRKVALLMKAVIPQNTWAKLTNAKSSNSYLGQENNQLTKDAEVIMASTVSSSATDPAHDYEKEVSTSSSKETDEESTGPSSSTENWLSVNVPEGSLSHFSKLFQTTDVWEQFLSTKKVEWPPDSPHLKVCFQGDVLGDLQNCLCLPALPKDVASKQLQTELIPLTPEMIKRDKKARQHLYDTLVAIAVQEQLAQQLEEISETEFGGSLPESLLANFEAHKLAVCSLIWPLRDAISDFFTARLSLRNRVFSACEDSLRIKNLKRSSPFCNDLFPERLVEAIHKSLRLANLYPSIVFKTKTDKPKTSETSKKKRISSKKKSQSH